MYVPYIVSRRYLPLTENQLRTTCSRFAKTLHPRMNKSTWRLKRREYHFLKEISIPARFLSGKSCLIIHWKSVYGPVPSLPSRCMPGIGNLLITQKFLLQVLSLSLEIYVLTSIAIAFLDLVCRVVFLKKAKFSYSVSVGSGQVQSWGGRPW